MIVRHPNPPAPPVNAPVKHPCAGLKSPSFEPLANSPNMAPPTINTIKIINQPGLNIISHYLFVYFIRKNILQLSEK